MKKLKTDFLFIYLMPEMSGHALSGGKYNCVKGQLKIVIMGIAELITEGMPVLILGFGHKKSPAFTGLSLIE